MCRREAFVDRPLKGRVGAGLGACIGLVGAAAAAWRDWREGRIVLAAGSCIGSVVGMLVGWRIAPVEAHKLVAAVEDGGVARAEARRLVAAVAGYDARSKTCCVWCWTFKHERKKGIFIRERHG